MKTQIFLLIVLCVVHTNAIAWETECKRPPPGVYDGSCVARDAHHTLDIEKSPQSLHKWITCMQEERGWGSGGYSDAIFFTDLVPEWQAEIDAFLSVLDNRLRKRDRKLLQSEQRAWEKAKDRALAKRARQPTPQGTMYMAIGATAVMDFYERRALELGCRVEKLMN